MEIITKSAVETQKMGESLGLYLKKLNKKLNGAFTITLDGELGSGKTTFVRGLAFGLGIPRRILSPTFGFVRQYELSEQKAFGRLFHLDWYKLNDQEIKDVHFQEFFEQPDVIIVIEWAKRLDQLPQSPQISIKFTSLEDETHKLEIKDETSNFVKFIKTKI